MKLADILCTLRYSTIRFELFIGDERKLNNEKILKT